MPIRKRARTPLFIISSFALLSIAASLFYSRRNEVSMAGRDAPMTASQAERESFAVTILAGPDVPRVDLGVTDSNGNTVTAACSTCHATRKPSAITRAASSLTEFHQGLAFAHGNVTCLSCHNAEDFDTLKLADGTAIAYPDVMQLCAQCHGPQTRDYKHGAHGGMTGHWDLSRGPRTRNNCVGCHDPHAPAFPKMNPTFKPRDRFLESNEH